MTSPDLWVQGARPKTLGVAFSCVLVGTAAASLSGPTQWVRASAALLVALALQVGVNYANDYSDGVRGADAHRVGPVRLTATGLATPAAVRRASIIAFAVAAAAGAALAFAVNPWLLVIGAAAIVAAVTYTGGPKPYGYAGLGELMVLVFFGFVGTTGSAYVQHQEIPAVSWFAALVVGLPACAILLANNIRDIATDSVAGKRTLAVRAGAARARALYTACIVGALVAVVVCAIFEPWALVALLAAPFAVASMRVVGLLPAVRFQVVVAVLLAVGLWLA